MLKAKSMLMLFIASTFVLVAGLLFTLNTNAQNETGNGLKVSPTRIELEVERGGTNQIEITIENITDLPINSEFIVNDFIADEEGTGSPRIILNEESDLAAAYSIKNFVDIDGTYDLPPRVPQNITFDVNVPESTDPGSYFGVVRAAPINSLDSNSDQGTQLGLTASVGTIVIITVPGDTVELLTLKDIGVSRDDGGTSSFFESAPNNVEISLNNEGNVITKPFGLVRVLDWSDNEVYSYELNNTEPRGNVLPGSFRTFVDGIEGISGFGRYTVQANISYGPSGGSIITAETSFWVVPWKAILAGIAVVIGLILIFTYGVKAYNRYIVNRSRGERIKNK